MLNKILAVMVLAIATITLMLSPAAIAADLGNGTKVFTNNCATCHMGGGNVVNRAKTLKQEALEQYGMASEEAIKTQVTNGKNAMPAFKGRLSEQQIEDVAAYVLDQSAKGW